MGNLGFVPWKIVTLRPRRIDQPTGLSIYALIDPRDMLIRYVGFTKRELHRRLEVHLGRPVNKAMRQWFASLALAGTAPLIERICWTTEERWERDEMYWIGWCRQIGRLLNVDAGGDYRLSKNVINPAKRKRARNIVRGMLGGLGLAASESMPRGKYHRQA